MKAIYLPGVDYTFSFNPFADGNFLGEGGMSFVYKGLNQSTGEPVAIKVLKSHLCRNPQYLERARRESSIRLDHPNIIKVYDFVEKDRKYHLVIEYMEGQNLAEKIDANYQFSKKEVVDIALSILQGLQVLHQHFHPIIHRDIKSSNIMVCNDGTIKIMDFGVSKVDVEAENNSVLTTVGVKIGTPPYSSPEQLLGQNDLVDHRTDIYSTGIIMYELLVGKLPFDHKNNYVLQNMIINDPLPMNAAIPSDLWTIIKKATQKKREARYQNVEEFIEVVKALKNPESTSTPSSVSKIKLSPTMISIVISVIIFMAFLFLIIGKNN